MEIDYLWIFSRFVLYTESSKLLFAEFFSIHVYFLAYCFKELLGIIVFIFARPIRYYYLVMKRRFLSRFPRRANGGLLRQSKLTQPSVELFDKAFLRTIVYFEMNYTWIFLGILVFIGSLPIPWLQSMTILLLIVVHPKEFRSLKTFVRQNFFLALYCGSAIKVAISSYSTWFDGISTLSGAAVLTIFLSLWLVRRFVVYLTFRQTKEYVS